MHTVTVNFGADGNENDDDVVDDDDETSETRAQCSCIPKIDYSN